MPTVVHFTHATASHKSMIETVLTQEEAPMTHSVFNFQEKEAAAEEQPPAEEGAENAAEKPPEDILTTF